MFPPRLFYQNSDGKKIEKIEKEWTSSFKKVINVISLYINDEDDVLDLEQHYVQIQRLNCRGC